MSVRTQDRSSLLPGAWVLGTWLCGALIFYRAQWTSGFNNLMGNTGDSRLAAYLSEEWFRVFQGQAPWLSPPIFDPVKGVLGWSDTFLIYEVFYTPLRLVGLDPFVALQVTVILLSLVGFASFYALVRLLFATPRYLALALALIATFSNALYVHVADYQLAGIYVVPAVALLGVVAWRAPTEGRRKKAVGLGCCLGLLAGLLIYSTYYVAYFSLLALGILLLVSAVGGGRRLLRRAMTTARHRAPTIVATLGGFCAGLVPFFVTYLPVPGSRHGRSLASVMRWSPKVIDLMNVTPENGIWGSLLHRVAPSLVSQSFADSYAVTPLLLVTALAGAVLCLYWLSKGSAARPSLARATVALAATTLIMVLLPFHVGHVELWALFYHLPGASALRAIGRAGLVAGLLAVLTTASAGAEVASHIRGRRRAGWRAAAAGLAVLLVAEQYNVADVSNVDNRAQVALLDRVTGPPAGCHSFYVVGSSDAVNRVALQIDAMLVSQKVSLPTVNGYSGLFPSRWHLIGAEGNQYLVDVRTWASEHGLETGLCQLDLTTDRWEPVAGTDATLAAASKRLHPAAPHHRAAPLHHAGPHHHRRPVHIE